METQSITSALTNTPSSVSRSGLNATKDQFLKLLLAQLKYQDPLQPPDASKFGEQMTQFGQLEQLFNVNDTLKNISTTSSVNDRSQAVSFIGKNVTAYGDQLEVTADSANGIGYELGAPASEVNIDIKNSSGRVVRTIHLTNQQAGLQYQPFDGLDNQGNRLAAGVYQVSVKSKTGTGAFHDEKTLINGAVDGVDFSEGSLSLRLGHRFVDVSSVISVSGN